MKLERAAKRLRQLGISRGAAKRFTGEDVFDDVIEDEIGEGLLAGEESGSGEQPRAKPVRG